VIVAVIVRATCRQAAREPIPGRGATRRDSCQQPDDLVDDLVDAHVARVDDDRAVGLAKRAVVARRVRAVALDDRRLDLVRSPPISPTLRSRPDARRSP
jgi:hypothetical protein